MSQIERGLDDTTQGTLRIGTECRGTVVSEGTLPARPMPSTVLVTWWSVHAGEVATSFHGIPGVWYHEWLYFCGRGDYDDDVPVSVVLVHILLRCHDLVDGSDFRTRGGVPPRTLELLGHCSPILSDLYDESLKLNNLPLLNVSFSSAIPIIAGAFCITETSQVVQKMVFPDLSAFLQATQPLWANLQKPDPYSPGSIIGIGELKIALTFYESCHNTFQELRSNPYTQPSGSPGSNRC